ncbi:uncharacterized protein LOC664274 [Tribolium castaneum]|uniref:Uncharacterized protein n=1 Tax=Tribolium castaneum TaxID=7070 RepID=D2A0H4_TRICA|nr:PREDICTED: uncharacterized protein LOC664274 [Tribolium castaneum]XP_008192317.1 PREDICTED: uncharacterized protein LOC664274 [Tribolium castaneum]XP_008192318.1 PREDICTED: uncharacterized protein LOC664274 [Tribolium castaneum]XP_015834966.1 PREDICTED: uncharacterized protein LOC664274 [Tribolium castaneum]EFA01686.1 hypothetical protein TcasGA2_TC007261 [Tribolium castaneum]|eukprot:XP_008192316.1 PREDICTED: uncharacterized protein LOC664274 [Tribolium castaneum]
MAPEISNCCGFSLKHGTIIIGVVQSIISFMFLVLSAAYAEHPHELLEMSDPGIVPEISVLRCLLIIIAVASAVQCILSISIIFAAETNRPVLLVPWLIFNPVAVVVYIISILVAIIHHSGDNATFFIIGHLIIGAIVSLIALYNIIAVHSFYKHLKSLNF